MPITHLFSLSGEEWENSTASALDSAAPEQYFGLACCCWACPEMAMGL